MKKLFILAAVVLGFAATSFAQLKPQASFSASVDLQTALHIENAANLNFGTIYFPAAGGDVTIAGSQAATISGAGFYELSDNNKTAAKFTYGGGQSTLGTQGSHSYTFSIFEMSYKLKNAAGKELTFTPEPGIGGNINGDLSERYIYIGGKLNVPAGTLPGVYTCEGMLVSIQQQ